MKIKHLLEGVEPKMPGAPKGISIMTPQQFVAKSERGEEPEQGVAEGSDKFSVSVKKDKSTYPELIIAVITNNHTGEQKVIAGDSRKLRQHLKHEFGIDYNFGEQGVAEGSLTEFAPNAGGEGGNYLKALASAWYNHDIDMLKDIIKQGGNALNRIIDAQEAVEKILARGIHCGDGKVRKYMIGYNHRFDGVDIQSDDHYEYADHDDAGRDIDSRTGKPWGPYDVVEFGGNELDESVEQGVAEGQDHLDRIRSLSGLDEATKLPASTRDLGGQEFQDYMKRIVGTPDLDKAGNVKIDKKGNEKYVSGKTKTDRYKLPYIHRSSVITYMSPDGKTFDEDAVKKTLAIRPKTLLKQNEKMKHSNGEFEQFFNVGFAALVGLALDEQTNNLIVVNTCPGAGSCKVDCFAMKGGKIQFQGPWQSDGRILTYLLNDPDGFFNQLSAEITAESNAGKKGDKKFPNGWQTTIRWHDAGDFFSPEYLDMALKMAAKHPDVKFYAYTKMAGAALAKKPPNFIINWSEGAHTSQEKQVKAKDANLDTTKNSRIVPDNIFQDLLIKDQKGNLVKGDSGQWQVQPEKLPELKQRLAKQYGLSSNSILSYDEYMAKRKSIPAGMKYNVIVAPGEGDISANDPNVIATLLLKH